MATGEFDLSEWAKHFELSEETLAALSQKGFATKRTLSKLTTELIKTEFKKLSLAQSLLLQDACGSLNEPVSTAAADIQPQIQVSSTGSSSTSAPLTAQDVATFLNTGGSVISNEGTLVSQICSTHFSSNSMTIMPNVHAETLETSFHWSLKMLQIIVQVLRQFKLAIKNFY
jgi:hypothetical protein